MDIHNTKEVIKLAIEIAKPILKEVRKDGYQPSDLLAFITSEAFQNAIGPALTDITLVPTEMKELDNLEKKELVHFVVDCAFDLVI